MDDERGVNKDERKGGKGRGDEGYEISRRTFRIEKIGGNFGLGRVGRPVRTEVR